MSFEKYIDFGNVVSNIADGTNLVCLKMKSKKCKYVVAGNIKKIKIEKIIEIFDMIINAEEEIYEKYEEDLTFNNWDVSMKINSTYISENKKYIICFFCVWNIDDSNMLGLVDVENNKYVFLGYADNQPYIATNDFVFVNSDEFSSDISKHFEQLHDEKTIFKYLKKYYVHFIDSCRW